MAEFDELLKQLNDLDSAELQRQDKAKSLHEQDSKIQEQLKALTQQRNDLLSRETTLKNNTSNVKASLANLESESTKSKSQRKQLMVQLEVAKQKRNKDLIAWWMRTYSEFDSMSLQDLQDWLIRMIKYYKSTLQNPSGSSNRGNHINPQNIARARREKWIREEQAVHTLAHKNLAHRDLKHGKDDEQNQEHVGQTLSEKQRIKINQDENDPIDTLQEAQDAEELSSPLGSREAEDDADDYLDHLGHFDDDDDFPNKQSAAKDLLKDLDL